MAQSNRNSAPPAGHHGAAATRCARSGMLAASRSHCATREKQCIDSPIPETTVEATSEFEVTTSVDENSGGGGGGGGGGDAMLLLTALAACCNSWRRGA